MLKQPRSSRCKLQLGGKGDGGKKNKTKPKASESTRRMRKTAGPGAGPRNFWLIASQRGRRLMRRRAPSGGGSEVRGRAFESRRRTREGQAAKMAFPKYKPSRLASLPSTLDPAEYDISPETRKAQAERLAIRSRLKQEYLLQYNDPSRRGLIVSERWLGGGRGLEPPGSPARLCN